MICAYLIGRDGSKGLPGKNTRPILGRPLMAYPLLAARNARSIGRTFVSTDSPAIAAVARASGATILSRDPALCTDGALCDDVFADGLRQVRKLVDEPIELLVLLMCNAPMILASQIEEGIAALRAHEDHDSAVTVSRYNMWSPLRARRIGADGLLRPFVPLEAVGDVARLSCDRDSQGDVWFADMGVSIVRLRCLEHVHDGLLPQRWMGRRIWPIRNDCGLDVDYEWQLPVVEHWLRSHGFTEARTPYDRA